MALSDMHGRLVVDSTIFVDRLIWSIFRFFEEINRRNNTKLPTEIAQNLVRINPSLGPQVFDTGRFAACLISGHRMDWRFMWYSL